MGRQDHSPQSLAVLRSHPMVRAILDALTLPAAVIMARDGRVLEGNAAFFEALGRPADAVLDHPAPFDVSIADAAATAGGPASPPPSRRRCAFLRADGVLVQATLGVGVLEGVAGLVLVTLDGIAGADGCPLRRRAEATVPCAADRFRSLFDLAPIGMAMLDGERRWRQANSVMCRLLGVPFEGLAAKRWSDSVHPEDRGRDERFFASLLRNDDKASTTNLRLVAADGRVVPVTLSLGVMRDGPKGQSDQILVLVQDISERVDWEATKAENEARLRSLINATTDAIFLLDPDGAIRVINRAGARLLGTTARAAAGRSFYEFLDAPQATERRALFGEVLATLLPVNGIERWGERWLDMVVFPVVDGDGKAMGVTLFTRDITSRREAEDRARAAERHLLEATELMSAAMLLFDPQGILVLINSACRAALPDLEDILHPGLSFIELRAAIVARRLFVQAITESQGGIKGGTPGPAPIEVRGKDGRWLLIRQSATSSGYTLILGTDITELKRRERALADAKEVAEYANRAKSEFLANMSHELRTPLNAIIGFSDITRHQMFGRLDNPVYVDYARNIYDSGTHLLEIISDILDLAKIEAGELGLDEEEVDAARLVDSAIQMVTPRATSKRIALTNLLTGDLPRLWCDPLRLKQVLINLLSNAVKYTQEDGAVAVTARLAGGDGLAISVIDTGIGMDEAGIQVAMTAFGQVESPYSRRQGGTGLGLPLTRKLTEAHQGCLTIASRPGEGTTVTILLPAHRLRAAS
ncbi:PAS domain-containing protein [Rhodospirillum rubrum]|uniref:PAS domain-containing protein n=1 Tax=Rhodospirillum rubrum TaxID=1085 RepID=UPI001ED92AA9|nr:PAS domain-containing protein [Rhodospirillum rubrum]